MSALAIAEATHFAEQVAGDARAKGCVVLKISLPTESSAASLRAETRARACASLCFFARNVLGLRNFEASRLDALQGGAAPQFRSERSLLRNWRLLRRGAFVRECAWLFASRATGRADRGPSGPSAFESESEGEGEVA